MGRRQPSNGKIFAKCVVILPYSCRLPLYAFMQIFNNTLVLCSPLFPLSFSLSLHLVFVFVKGNQNINGQKKKRNLHEQPYNPGSRFFPFVFVCFDMKIKGTNGRVKKNVRKFKAKHSPYPFVFVQTLVHLVFLDCCFRGFITIFFWNDCTKISVFKTSQHRVVWLNVYKYILYRRNYINKRAENRM